ncbi:hypothetical protein N6L24_12505 [Cognatishimia sp. SS12]|uniref:hypothetical protein n=1 Tax=Cognatishimia sp. SS12 TaxID=2979465 RepID=UPI00232B51F3|nr:hypothetical protein [Cognatishimia sp. SS12]MDC0739102.1 hypothetical protein [Cognatishimia sp. SS12]
MEDALTVSPYEGGVIRLFSVDIDAAELARIKSPKTDMPPTGAAIADLVGLDWIDPAHAEIFDISDLEEMGLYGYLTEGAGVSPETLIEKRAALSALKGVVLILFSGAFDDKGAQLTPARHVSLVDVFHEAGAPIQFGALPSKAALEPSNQGSPAAHPQLNVMKAMLILPAICLVIGIIVWILL